MTTKNWGQILADATPAFRNSADFPLRPHTIALLQTGSHAYGTNTPTSDEDYLAIVLPRMRHIVGLGTWEHFEPGKEDGIDLKAQSIGKYVKLALAGNPNVVETLFFEPENFLYVAPAFQTLLDHKELFLSREVYKRFGGYARGQMQKMTSGVKDTRMSIERREWVDKIGYDPKDASHLIRLLFQGIELAREGTLTPRLKDVQREVVIKIKQGTWTLDEVKGYAEHLAVRGEIFFEKADCPLPEKPDTEFIEVLLMEIHRNAVR